MRPHSSSTNVEALRRTLGPIFRKYGVDRAILFGSLARGEGTRRSDADILAVQETSSRFLDRYDGILAELVSAVPHLGVDLFVYTPGELRAMAHRPFIRQALAEGLVIYERDQGEA